VKCVSFQGLILARVSYCTEPESTPKCLGFRLPVEAFLEELGTNVSLRFNPESTGSLMGDTAPRMVLAFVLKFISK